MNAMLPHVAKPCSWHNYAQTELALKHWALGSPTMRSMRDPEGRSLKTDESLKAECSLEAGKSPKAKGDHEELAKYSNRADITSSIHVQVLNYAITSIHHNGTNTSHMCKYTYPYNISIHLTQYKYTVHKYNNPRI